MAKLRAPVQVEQDEFAAISMGVMMVRPRPCRIHPLGFAMIEASVLK